MFTRRTNSRQRRNTGSLNAGGGVFSPATLGSATRRFWHDAQDSATTIAGSWVDKFSNGYDVTQGTPSKQPTLSTAAFGGRQSLLFSAAASQELIFTHATKITDFAGGTDVAYDWWVVLQPIIVAGATIFTEVDSTSSATTYSMNIINAGAWTYERRDGVGADTLRAQTGVSASAGVPYVLRCGYDGTNAVWRANGVNLATAGSSDVGAMALDRLIYGAYGNGAGAHSAYYTGYIGESIGVTGLLSSSEVGALENYLKAKWGIIF